MKSTTRDSSRPVPHRITGRSHRDYAFFCNGLLPLLDFVMLLLAGLITTKLFANWFHAAELHGHRWDEHYVLAMIAVLAPILLYDKRFVAVASRGHGRALVRCYLTNLLLLGCAILIIGWASGILRVVPTSVLLTWFAMIVLLTGSTRVLLAYVVQYCVRKGWLVDSVAIVGSGAQAKQLLRYLQRAKPVKPDVLGLFDDIARPRKFGERGRNRGAMLTGTLDDLIELGKVRRIDWIFLAVPYKDEDRMAAVVNRLKALSVPIALCPQSPVSGGSYKMIDYIGDTMPIALIELPAQNWRSKIRSAGQFLPRWITTLTLLIAWGGRLAWLKFRAGALNAGPALVCELDDYEPENFVAVARDFGQQRFAYAVTPNVDHFIRLHDDAKFRELYAGAEFVLMDSRFMSHVLRVTGRGRLPVCTGSDVTARLLQGIANSNDRLVVIGGSSQQVSALTTRFELKNLKHHNPPMGFINDAEAVNKCVDFVESHSPFRFCLLALGSPQQEMLAHHLRSRGVAKGLALCVGASIDFLTGVERRAPAWMRRCGMEWSYRLVQNPRRLAGRYLLRGPRIFALLSRTNFVLRDRSASGRAGDPEIPATAGI